MHRGDDADDDRTPAVDEAGAGSDRDEADDHAVDAADQARLAPGQVVEGDPDQEGDRGAEVGVEHRRGGDVAGVYQSPPLKPFQPIQSRPAPTATIARLFGASTSRSRCSRGPITQAATKPGDAGGEVDHVTTGEVDRALLGEEATAPDQEGVDRVDEAGSRGRRTGSTL